MGFRRWLMLTTDHHKIMSAWVAERYGEATRREALRIIAAAENQP
jgi:hypothetical protein